MSKQRRNHTRSAVNIEPGIYEIDSGTAEIQADPFTPGAWLLLINGVHSSQLIPDEPQRLGFEYMRWIAIALGFRYPQDARLRFLHLGGGGATLARWGADRYPNSRHTTVELDAQLAELARNNFGLPRSPIVKMRVTWAARSYCVPLRAAQVTDRENAGGRGRPSACRNPPGELGCDHPGCVYRNLPRRPHYSRALDRAGSRRNRGPCRGHRRGLPHQLRGPTKFGARPRRSGSPGRRVSTRHTYLGCHHV